MEEIFLYHGSNHEIKIPEIGKGKTTNDYGQAFYCTKEEYAAKEWANKDTKTGVVNKYYFDGRGLNVLDLTDKKKYNVLHWVAILMHFRHLSEDFVDSHKRELDYLERHYYIDVTKYDVVIGFRADDSYFKFPSLFVNNELRLEALEEIYMLGYLGVQYALISEKAYKRLKFIKSEIVEPIFYDKYQKRIYNADNRFEELKNKDKYLDGTRILDLLKNDTSK